MTIRPRPVPDAVSAFYWEAAARGELAVLACDACDLAHHPPDVACPHCGAATLTPRTVSGRGRVFAACLVRQAFDAAFTEAVPYPLVLVELDDEPGVRVLTNVVASPIAAAGAAPPAVGTAVEVAFEDHGGWALPQFRMVAP